LRQSQTKKSWWLSDAQKLADEYPYTFHKPSLQAVALLKPSDEVKLIFQFDNDDPEAPSAERMWVEIREISGRRFKGVLDNVPIYIDNLQCGDPIEFEEKHIIQVSIDDPVPSKTDRYLPRCLVTHRILYEGAPVGYLYREEPHADNDSGWRIMCGDESQEYMDTSDNISCVSLGAVLREDDRIVDLLDEPIGSSFEFDPTSNSFIRADN
jgi:hypothetical protein